MRDSIIESRFANHSDPTLDASESMLIDFPEAPSLSPDPIKRLNIALVEVSENEQSDSLRLMRQRLLAAAFAFSVGFCIFALWNTIALIGGFTEEPIQWLLAEYSVFIVLIGIGVWLLWTPSITSYCAWSIEAIVFGLPAIFFAANSASMLYQGLEAGSGITQVGLLGWAILIFAHAIFIPNTWQRAAIITGIFGTLPIATTLIVRSIHPRGWERISEDPFPTIEMILGLIAACTVAVVGVRTIHGLRNEVSEAKQLGRYRLRKRIGAGGMGEVFLAEHQMLKRPCAIKVIRQEKAGDARIMARFEREVQASAKLCHWNNVHIFDYGRTPDGTLYYVMEYLPGLTLNELVQRAGPLPPGRVVYLLRQICAALSEAHGLHLIHRDVKPANIFVSERGGQFDVAKLLDFGLVKPILQQVSGDSELTHEGGITGSPLYMSPEQAMGEREPDQRSDIYSLGAVAYFMLAGKPPFPPGPAMKVMFQHVHETPLQPSLASEKPLAWEIPSSLEKIVLQCMAKSPQDRFSSVRAIERALESCSSSLDWNADLAEKWWKTHCPKLRAMQGGDEETRKASHDSIAAPTYG